ncbi:hypothetical protein, partial [Acinetobacter pittii]|uniref:hypothetical protein n=1 Tax=Acinetobacter pittii TaxID=48296 RepID=UPI00168D708A
FTEKFGIKLKKFPTLKTASLPANVFRTCNSELLEKSLTFWRAKEKMINFWEDLEPSRFFVQSSAEIITNYDNFTLDDSIATDKMVEIHARGKFNFVQKVKLWVGANVTVKLSEIVKNSLLRNELTNFHEYCVTSQMYVKNQTGLASKVIIDGKECFEMQKFDVVG